MKLALGTVQFGLSYGVANEIGQVRLEEISAILEAASKSGVDTLDTAINYGESESCLGQVGIDEWRVISKLPELPDGCDDVSGWVDEQLEGALERLGVQQLAGLLLHRPLQLLGNQGEELWGALLRLKEKGRVNKIGFSIYSPDELDALWGAFKPDLVQAPYNILDRRLLTSGWLDRMNQQGVELYVRSVFLQGLLLMDTDKRPSKFDRWSPLWEQWGQWLEKHSMTPLQGALSFVLAEQKISRVVVGVDSLDQFKEIVAASKFQLNQFSDELSVSDTDLLNPSNWGQL